MYKPHTIEQYKIQQFLDANFVMEHFLVSPLSRTSLLLEDKTGEQIAFGFLIIKYKKSRSRRRQNWKMCRPFSKLSVRLIQSRSCIPLKMSHAGG